MSDVHNTAASATEPVDTTTVPATEQPAVMSTESSAPVADAKPEVSGELAKETNEPATAITSPAGESKEAAAAADKVVEPITEGQLAYKGPGLIKSLVPSKKEFWLSDAPVAPQSLDLYTRGEKAEVSNPVVAWASQTGKGLLFFNKKGETDRARPHSVLALYDATDLKKDSPHEITFRLHGHQHTLKASNDAERDGWFISLERAIEVGKAEKEAVHGSEGYKSEHDKLTKPIAAAAAGAASATGAAATRSKSHPKTSGEPRRTGSDADEEADKKKKSSRSTSRGMLDRLKGKKDEMEVKREEKKEEKEEKKLEKEEAKQEKEAEKAGVIGGVAAPLDAPGTAERAVSAPIEDSKPEVAAESAPVTDSAIATPKTEDKKPAKRGSIFGRMQSGFSSIKSPSKEKSEKEAELKPEVPPKDTSVSETAPQIPEPTTHSVETAAAAPVDASDKPSGVTEQTTESSGKPAEAAKEQLDGLSPTVGSKKGGFLAGLPFMSKRDRSVSPSAAMKDVPKKEENPVLPVKDETADPRSEEPSKPVSEPAAPVVAPVNEAEKPIEKAEEPTEPTSDAASPTANKRQSVFGNFGNLGRRASKAFKGIGASANSSPAKKEDVAPAATTEAKKDAPDATASAVEEPKVNGHQDVAVEPESKAADEPAIGQAQTTPVVTASA